MRNKKYTVELPHLDRFFEEKKMEQSPLDIVVERTLDSQGRVTRRDIDTIGVPNHITLGEIGEVACFDSNLKNFPLYNKPPSVSGSREDYLNVVHLDRESLSFEDRGKRVKDISGEYFLLFRDEEIDSAEKIRYRFNPNLPHTGSFRRPNFVKGKVSDVVIRNYLEKLSTDSNPWQHDYEKIKRWEQIQRTDVVVESKSGQIKFSIPPIATLSEGDNIEICYDVRRMRGEYMAAIIVPGKFRMSLDPNVAMY